MMKHFKNIQFWSWICSALLLISLCLLIWALYSLNILPSDIQLYVIIFLCLLVCIFILLQVGYFHTVRAKGIMLVFTCLLCLAFSTVSFYLLKTNNALDIVTSIRNHNQNVISVVALNDSDVKKLEDLRDKKVAVLKSIDRQGTDTAIQDIQKTMDTETLPFELIEVDSVPQEVNNLYDRTVDAIILNEAYRNNVIELEDYADFSSRTSVIHQTTFNTSSNNEPLAVSDVTTKPYNILISGNDTYGDVGELSRSDVNMVVTVNPMTSTVLLTSIPRDSYVEVDCGDAYSCAAGERDKITHTGLNGITSTKQTVEKLLDIEINYTFRVNFSSVTDIVDSLGGIDVEVPEGLAVETFYADSTLEGVTEGWNHLDGARALSFARERYAYVDGDNQRVRNQQTVLKAIFNKATSPDIIANYPQLLDALQKAFDTNLTRDEITDFIKYQIQARPGWKFESYQLAGDSDMLFCPSMGQAASVIVLDYNTVALAHDKIQAVLDGRDADDVTEPEIPSESVGLDTDSYQTDDQNAWGEDYSDDYIPYEDYSDGIENDISDDLFYPEAQPSDDESTPEISQD